MSRSRGAALLLVMWLVLLLSGLVASYAMSARIESMQGNGAARGATARTALPQRDQLWQRGRTR